MDVLNHYKTQHLFLLIGENPLPNYVAAQLLLADQGTVYLVHSTHTQKIAKERLTPVLKQHGIAVKWVSLNEQEESDGCAIARILQEEVSKIPSNEPIGLHYTGGTKTMAAHAYRAFLNLKRSPQPVFSYLDARRLELCIDDLENQQTQRHSVALAVQPSLETILSLHNLQWKPDKAPQKTPIAKEAAMTFATFHAKETDGKAWRTWCNDFLYTLKQSKGENSRWKSEEDLTRGSRLKIDCLPNSIIQVLRPTLDASPTELDLALLQKKITFPSLESICQWLDGIWLEEYVLTQIQNAPAQLALGQPVMSLRIKDPKNVNNPNRGDQFEFDVAFLRGYQLFGISCTTSLSHARCKQKLFEAILRARQLGGDEARIALMSANSDATQVKWLKQEVSLAISDRKIEVFGREDLDPNKFSRKLTDWIQRNI